MGRTTAGSGRGCRAHGRGPRRGRGLPQSLAFPAEAGTEMTQEGAVIRRIRVRSVWICVVLSAGAFLFGWRRGVSLTICASVVIFSFLVFEKLTGRLVASREKWKVRALVPLLLVTAASIALLVVALHWKAFDPIAGAIGLSAVVLAIGGEIFEKGGR